MSSSLFLLALIFTLVVGFYAGQRRALASVSQAEPVDQANRRGLRALPRYYGYNVALWVVIPVLLIWLFWLYVWPMIGTSIIRGYVVDVTPGLEPGALKLAIQSVVSAAKADAVSMLKDQAYLPALERYRGFEHFATSTFYWLLLLVAVCVTVLLVARSTAKRLSRHSFERTVVVLMSCAAGIAILVTIGIVYSMLYQAFLFFSDVSIFEFLTGLKWSVQTAIREGQAGASGSFGAVPVFAGTLLISFIAMCVAIPIGLYSAIYLSEYAGTTTRALFKPILEILAGIPTVVYGVFAALTVAPFIRGVGESIGLDVASESALAAGSVMGIMIIPFVSSFADDAIQAVPRSLRDGSMAIGATQAETIKKVVLPAALPGISGGILLAVSRAIGETMIVVMAAGLFAQLTFNPLEAVSTVTVQIVGLLIGDTEFDSTKTRAAFALGLTLFTATLLLNVLAMRIVRKYREKYV